MDICGHCGGMDRHHSGCRFDEIALPDAGAESSQSISAHDPQHAAPSTHWPRSSTYILAGLLAMFMVLFVAALTWP